MRYDHKVKYRGAWYRPGEEVPNTEDASDKETPNADKAHTDGEKMSDADSEKKYTKSEIARMPVDELRQLAISAGVENAHEMNGTELKRYLVSLFGL